jgi:hypothetical protein
VTAARDRRGTRLLDPRWHWIQAAARRLYAELDSDQTPAGLTLMAATVDAGMVYAAAVDSPEIQRFAVTDLDALQATAGTGLTDVTPPTTPEGLT